jgi:mannan endo-1,4-beta-mannosidase
MISSWIETISSYIKGIDSEHMVTVGDEGWFTTAQGYGDSYPYSGSIGIDWDTNLKVSSIDYGTYPESWGESDDWGNTWITQHSDQAKSVGKPVVLEEFGTTDTSTRYNTVNGWLNSAYSGGYGGMQYWQFVSKLPSGYQSPDDGNGISTTESTYSVIKSMASMMNASSQ